MNKQLTTTTEQRGTDLPPLELPEQYNYVAAFLTLSCNLDCSDCITSFGNSKSLHGINNKMIPGAKWIEGLNRLALPEDIPITLQGGEPSLHPDFFEIINGIRPDMNIDMLTNLQFDVKEFMKKVPADRVRRNAPYASIRTTYHPEVMKLDDLRKKVLLLLEKGYSVGIWASRHPLYLREVDRAEAECARDGIDFRFKEFLGLYNGELHGTYKYPDAMSLKKNPPVHCRTTELLIAPSGNVFRCHSDLYSGREPIGHICDSGFIIEDRFRPCEAYGFCNPCDVKVKTNRLQQFGHTSVEIRRPDRD